MAELADDADDVTLALAPAPTPWASSIDLRRAWLWEEHDGLRATIEVADLSALTPGGAGALQDTMFFMLWQTSYQNASGAAARTGEWMLRAEYRPMDAAPWHYWLERPCRDGNDDDGCPGPQRDIIDGLDGAFDVANDTVTMAAPWRWLAEPQPGDGVWGITAGAQMVWPSYPAYAADWDLDERDSCLLFATLPLTPDRLEGNETGPTGSSHGMTTHPGPRPAEDPCPAARASQGGAQDPPVATPTPSPGGQGTPAPGLAGLVAALAAGALLRRGPGRCA